MEAKMYNKNAVSYTELDILRDRLRELGYLIPERSIITVIKHVEPLVDAENPEQEMGDVCIYYLILRGNICYWIEWKGSPIFSNRALNVEISACDQSLEEIRKTLTQLVNIVKEQA